MHIVSNLSNIKLQLHTAYKNDYKISQQMGVLVLVNLAIRIVLGLSVCVKAGVCVFHVRN